MWCWHDPACFPRPDGFPCDAAMPAVKAKDSGARRTIAPPWKSLSGCTWKNWKNYWVFQYVKFLIENSSKELVCIFSYPIYYVSSYHPLNDSANGDHLRCQCQVSDVLLRNVSQKEPSVILASLGFQECIQKNSEHWRWYLLCTQAIDWIDSAKRGPNWNSLYEVQGVKNDTSHTMTVTGHTITIISKTIISIHININGLTV